MAESPDKLLPKIVRQMLRPLIRILLRYGISHRTFAEYAKQSYVEVAQQDFAVPGRKASISRISVLTGLTRKDVARLLRDEEAPTALAEHTHRAARVIGAWIREPAFNDKARRPRALPSEGRGSFAELVRKSRVDIPPRALLDELVRVGAVVNTRDGRYRLITRAYVPRDTESEKLELLGLEVADLTSSFDHNLTHPASEAYFQRAVRYDNLVASCLPELRDKSASHGQALLEQLDRFMSENDRDANPELADSERVRAVIGIYYYEEPTKDEQR